MNIRIFQTAISVTLFSGLLFIASCQSDSGHKAREAETVAKSESPQQSDDTATVVALSRQQYQAAGIAIGKIKNMSLGGTLSVNGLVDVPPQSKVSVSFPYGGFVRKINVLEGDYVKKGSLLAILENPEYVDLQESYLKSKSRLEYARQEYERQQDLYQADVAAGKSYQKAVSDYRSLKASVAAMAQKLRLLGIRPDSLSPDNIRSTVNILAPETGYITTVNGNQGKYINAQEELMELDNTRNIHIDLTIYEKDLAHVHAGQDVSFTLSGDESEIHKARITLIGRAVREDRSVLVHAIPTNPTKSYVPGTYVRAKIQLAPSERPAVPQEALVRSDGKQYLFMVLPGHSDEHHFKMIPVNAGSEKDGYVQVELPEGLNVADVSIVTKGAFSLLSVLKNTGEDEH